MTIDNLPTFSVHAIAQDRTMGSFTDNRWIGERYIGYVIAAGEHFVRGRFVTIDIPNKAAAFVPDNVTALAELRAGNTYPRIDGHWGWRAQLVLDRKRLWTQRTFEAADAICYDINSRHLLRKASGQLPASGGTIVREGWDHEHCDICWATLSPHRDPTGMFSEPNHWLCRECYAKYVIPRSLDFIVERIDGGR